MSEYIWVVPGSLGQVPIEVRVTSSAAGDAVRRLLLVKVPPPTLSSSVCSLLQFCLLNPLSSNVYCRAAFGVISLNHIKSVSVLFGIDLHKYV